MKPQLSIFEQINELAYRDARQFSGEKHNRIFLMGWWSKHYGRPLKDPVLLSYTIEELAYEYYLTLERDKAEEDLFEEESDKIEEAKDKEEQEWADKMEAEEAAQAPDPLLDPKNVEWMQQEIERDKAEHGEDFGEDISVDFEDK